MKLYVIVIASICINDGISQNVPPVSLLDQTIQFRRVDSVALKNFFRESQCSKSGINGKCVNFWDCPKAIRIYSSSSPDRLSIIQKLVCRHDPSQGVLYICCPTARQSTVTFPGPGATESRLSQPTRTQGQQQQPTQIRPPSRENQQGSVIPSDQECGRSIDSRIVGGRTTKPGDWPWLAALGYFENGRFVLTCGGTLITRRHVLSAAHCFIDPVVAIKPTYVRLGDHDIQGRNDGVIAVDVRITKTDDAGYNHITRVNDVFLLHLERDVSFGDYIRPACLPFQYKNSNFDGKILEVVGRGVTRFSQHGGVLTEAEPLVARVDVTSLNICHNIYSKVRPPNPTIDNRVLCVGTGKTDACEGDSGGPLNYLDGSNRYYVVGVVSYGLGCGIQEIPAIYMRVGAYLDWIVQHL